MLKTDFFYVIKSIYKGGLVFAEQDLVEAVDLQLYYFGFSFNRVK
jgi:hypothetical protein